jgi:outer membrane autotransporter protein
LPNFRPEVPVAMVAPALAQQLGLNMLAAGHRDRVGGLIGDDVSQGLWARSFGQRGSVGRPGGSDAQRLDAFVRHGPAYDLRSTGLQLGRDLLQVDRDGGEQVRAGLYAGMGRIDGDVRAVYGGRAGSVAMEGYALGAYWSLREEAGWYADGTVQGMRYGRVRMQSAQGEALRSQGWGMAASLEGGRLLPLGNGWSAEPSAQLIYQRTSLEGASDRFGLARFDAANAVYLRLGSRLAKDWTPPGAMRMSLWLRLDLWRSLGPGATTTFTTLEGAHPVSLRTGLGRTWGRAGIGFTGMLGRHASLSGSLDYSQGFETGRDNALTGRVLWTTKW